MEQVDDDTLHTYISARHANGRGSKEFLTRGLRVCKTSLSEAFMKCDVKATCLKSKSTGVFFPGHQDNAGGLLDLGHIPQPQGEVSKVQEHSC